LFNASDYTVIDQTWIKLIARLIGYLAVIAIGILSLVPGDMRPHTGAPGTFEHVAAYLGTAGLLTFGYGEKRPAITVLSLSLYSAAFEIAQTQIPGRHAAFSDFLASTIGAIVGSALAWTALKALKYISKSGSV
jgi:VanZ like family